MPEYKPRYLVMVTASANHNKYYKQIPHGDTWIAEYGRVGSNPQRRTYPMSQWESKYREKIKKGYVDQSDLVEDLILVEKSKPDSKYKEIENKVIADIVYRLQRMARQAITENYTITSNKVTQAMVDEAQNILTSLLDIKDVDEFNNSLLKLFTTIPRKMSNVQSYLANSENDFAKIIDKEQNLLDVMSGQVVQHQIIDDNEDEIEKCNNTILEQLGLVFEECTAKDISTIKVALGSCSDKFYNAWRVKNLKTQERYDKFVKENHIKNTKLLFHGSRNENWWSIINSGLMLKPTNAVITGKMFGYGIYYAPKARKSLGYTSLSGSYWARGSSNSGFMALMDVAYGTPYDVYSFDSKYYDFNYEALQQACVGANCLHAHEGSMLRNDEIIIYKEEQCTIHYLIELR